MTPVGENRQRLDLNSWVCQQFATRFKCWEIVPHWKVCNSWPRRSWCTVMWTATVWLPMGGKLLKKKPKISSKIQKWSFHRTLQLWSQPTTRSRPKESTGCTQRDDPYRRCKLYIWIFKKNYELNFSTKNKHLGPHRQKPEILKLQKLEIIPYIYQFWHTTAY